MSYRYSRRSWLVAAGGIGLAACGLNAAEPSDSESSSQTVEESIQQLKDGNQRFAEGHLKHAHESREIREKLASAQHPFATILGCSDSRVPPELVFDQGLGDLFVIRVAGNIIDDDVVGSIEYAVRHLKSHLMLVLGHQGCGAVTATLDTMTGGEDEPPSVLSLIKHIRPGLEKLDPKLAGAARLDAAVEANVRYSMQQLVRLPEAKKEFEENHVRVIGGVYQLGTGKVRFLE